MVRHSWSNKSNHSINDILFQRVTILLFPELQRTHHLSLSSRSGHVSYVSHQPFLLVLSHRDDTDFSRASDQGKAPPHPVHFIPISTDPTQQRMCVGRHMANNSLFIAIATILWAAKISPVLDEAGKPVIPDTLEAVSDRLVV